MKRINKLLSSYLENIGTYSKTIFYEQSRSTKDSNQKWIHPDNIRQLSGYARDAKIRENK